jgi:hypothetical protein
MSESWDGATSMSDAVAQETQRLATSPSVYAVIDPHGQLLWKDTMRQQEVEVMLTPGARLASERALSADVMLGSVDPTGRGSYSRITMISTGRTSIRGYRPDPRVAARHPEEYLVNLVGRRVRAGLSAGARQVVMDEELRGNLVLCGVDGDGTEIGLDYWQRQLIGTAFSAASTAAGFMASYRVVGARGHEASVYVPELQDPMSVDSARLAAWKLLEAANTVEGSSEENPLPELTTSTGEKQPRWKNLKPARK